MNKSLIERAEAVFKEYEYAYEYLHLNEKNGQYDKPFARSLQDAFDEKAVTYVQLIRDLLTALKAQSVDDKPILNTSKSRELNHIGDDNKMVKSIQSVDEKLTMPDKDMVGEATAILNAAIDNCNGASIGSGRYTHDEVSGLNNTYEELFGYVESALKTLQASPKTDNWRPISEAPRDKVIQLYRPNAPIWMKVAPGKYNPDKYAVKPKPYWECYLKIGGVTESRQCEATHYQLSPNEPSPPEQQQEGV